MAAGPLLWLYARQCAGHPFRREQLVHFLPAAAALAILVFMISARDLARFGQLYLANGVWKGRQIVPRAWIEKSFEGKPAFAKIRYGYLGSCWELIMEAYPGSRS